MHHLSGNCEVAVKSSKSIKFGLVTVEFCWGLIYVDVDGTVIVFSDWELEDRLLIGGEVPGVAREIGWALLALSEVAVSDEEAFCGDGDEDVAAQDVREDLADEELCNFRDSTGKDLEGERFRNFGSWSGGENIK